MQDQFLQKIDSPPMQITKNDPDKDLKKKKKKNQKKNKKKKKKKKT